MEPRCYRVRGFLIASSERELFLSEPLDDFFFSGIGDCPPDSLFPVRIDHGLCARFKRQLLSPWLDLHFVGDVVNCPKEQAYTSAGVSRAVWFSGDT